MRITKDDLGELIVESIKEYFDKRKTHISGDEMWKMFDFEKIPLQKLKNAYVDLTLFSNIGGFGDSFQFWDNQIEIVQESITNTIAPDSTKSAMIRQLGLQEWQIKEVRGANDVTIMILYAEINRNTDIIIKGMEACGWTFGTRNTKVIEGMKWCVMSFEPMFQDIVTKNVLEKYNSLYHWTPQYNLETILNNGLEPRSENQRFSYPNRLHFIKGSVNITDIINLGRQLYAANKNPKNNGDYILLSVDLKNFPLSVPIYYDPRYEGGLYTTEPISAKLLKAVYEYNFKTNIGHGLKTP